MAFLEFSLLRIDFTSPIPGRGGWTSRSSAGVSHGTVDVRFSQMDVNAFCILSARALRLSSGGGIWVDWDEDEAPVRVLISLCHSINEMVVRDC